MTSNAAHLTEDQLTDMVIAGEPAAGCRAHLAVCASCRERMELELATFGASIQEFNAATLAWSAAQPPPARVQPRQSFAFRFAPAALATCMVALAIATVPTWHTQAAPQDTPAQIAADDALLQSVDQALAANDRAPLDQYQLLDTPESAEAGSQ